MNITKTAGALAIAGIVAVGGAAFTAGGLATSGSASQTQFIGGTVSQSVTGATLNSITYDYGSDVTRKTVTGVTLVFAEDLESKTIIATYKSAGPDGTTSCDSKVYTDPSVEPVVPGYTTVLCTSADYAGLTGITVAVS